MEEEHKTDVAYVRERFKIFESKALKANLGERDHIRQESVAMPAAGIRKMATGWLDNLARLQAREEETEKQSSKDSDLGTNALKGN